MDSFPLVSIYILSCLLGLSVAAPIGPINVEIIRRGLTQRSGLAFALGCGAVTADCTYLSLALIGARTISALNESPFWRIIGLTLGSAMLIWLGVGAIRKIQSIHDVPRGVKAGEPAGTKPPGPIEEMGRTYLLGVALTLANPMTIALWISIAAGFAASGGEQGAPLVRLAGVFSGALSWVCFVTAVTAWAKQWISPFLMRAVNLVSGLMLIGYGLRFALRIFLH